MYGVLVLWGVSTVIFMLFHILPGDPAQMMLDQREDSEQLERIRKKYGFDQSLAVQYAYYMNDLSPLSVHPTDEGHYTSLASGKYNQFTITQIGGWNLAVKWPYLRESFRKTGKNVSEMIGESLPATILLAISAILFALLVGLPLGLLSALKKDSWWDRLIAIFGVSGMAVPSFFSAIVIAWLFGYQWSSWTGLNMTGSLFTVDDYGEGEFIDLKNLFLPALTLGIRPLAIVIQLVRASFLEVLTQDYIRTARAKGLPEWRVIFFHVLPNALNPVVTAVSGWFASLLAGAVFVEYIFAWNGLGKEIVEALNTLDLPVVMGAVLVIASMFVLLNIIVDIIYGILDPRVRIK